MHTSLLLGGYVALLLTVVGLWLALELIDPATEGTCPYAYTYTYTYAYTYTYTCPYTYT